jgi:hypothetical protein
MKDMGMHKEKTILFGNKWILMTLFIIHCSLFVHNSAYAQTFTQRLQTSAKGEAKVTLHQDPAIDKLVNGPQPEIKAEPANSKNEEKLEKKRETRDKAPAADKTTPDKAAAPHPENGGTENANAESEKNARTYKTTGYRIQVYAGGNSRKDRQKAEEAGNELRMLFPTESVYVHFYSPRWICRMGNFRSYEEASQHLQEVKKLGYSAATIVKGKIVVPY